MKGECGSMKINDRDAFFIKTFEKYKGRNFMTLLGIYKGNYGNLFGSAVFFVLKHSPVWVLPIVTSNIINLATGEMEGGAKAILMNMLLMVVLVMLNVPLNYIHTRFASGAYRSVEAGLRGALVRKLQQLSMTFHKNTASGRLQSKIMRDVEAVETLSNQLFVNLLQIVLNVIIALCVTVSRSMIVFGFFILTIPVATAIIVLFRKKIRRKNAEFRSEIEETSADVMEMVERVPVSRAHALEAWEKQRMTGRLYEVAKKGYSLDITQSFMGSISWMTFQIFQVCCLAFTGYMAFRNVIPIGDVVMYQNYFGSIINQVSAIITLIPILAKGLESLQSIGDILLHPDIEENEGKEKMEDVKGAFTFENVSFMYADGDRNILDGLDLTVQAGETVALVGESGAGKSTVLNLAVGFNLPTGGVVKIDGKDITELDLRSYREHISMVPQSSVLFTGSLRENITFGLPPVSEERLKEVLDAANLTDLVDSLPCGVDSHISEHGSNLSGGQRQRIAIARALIRDPKVILLDEATSALDSISERKIQEALERLMKGRTTLVVAHRLSTIQNADRIAVIEGGKCVEIGDYATLMAKKGAFYQLKQLQQ